MHRSSRSPLLAAVAAVGGFFALMALAYWWWPARWLDGTALQGFTSLAHHPAIHDVARGFSHLCDTGPFVLLSLVLLGATLYFRGPRRAAAAAMLLVGANASSQVLKPLLGHFRDLSHWPVPQIPAASYPSGHATASMSLALACVLVAPRAYRPLVAAVGGALAIAESFSVVILNWHFPSDTVGGYLLAGAWSLAALASLRAVDARWPVAGTFRGAARSAIADAALPAIAACVVIVSAVLLVTHAHEVNDFARAHTAAVAVGGGIVLSALVVLGALTALSRRRT